MQNEANTGQSVDDLLDVQKDFIKSVLNSYELFIDLDEGTFNELIQGFFSIAIVSDYVIYFQGKESKLFYIVEEGEVQLSDNNNNETTKCFNKEIFG